MTIASRVKAGIAYLDAVYDRKWREKIDKDRLDLSCSEGCPLGQTDEDYDKHCKILGLSKQTAFDLAFHISRADYYNPELEGEAERSRWYRLTQEWKKQLRR